VTLGRDPDLGAHSVGRGTDRTAVRDAARRTLARLVPDQDARDDLAAALGLDGETQAGICGCGCGEALPTHAIATGLTVRRQCRRRMDREREVAR
jgi:hypothetical protein